jgi:hypothetical protein
VEERGAGVTGSPENRAMSKGAIARFERPVAISSAISAPTPGASWKPWPLKPN